MIQMNLHAGHYINILIDLSFILYGIVYIEETHNQIRRRGYASAILTLLPYLFIKSFWILIGIVLIVMILLNAIGFMWNIYDATEIKPSSVEPDGFSLY